MEVINIDDIEGYMLGDEKTGTLRRIKTVFTSKNMRVHVGIFPPKQASSRHSHPNSEEIVYVVKGRGKVTAGDETREYGPNTLIFIPVGVPHQYFNTGDGEMVLLAIYSPPTELPSK
ncbi:cupin domain-containing protein [Candidatus Bathyarchaeota archaeon]|nr:MAG: cupin domain-containing protein [Candidatus Bathyarchaeota archaeon]